MASIDQRIKRPWLARVRIPGHQDETRSFETQTEAVKWAQRIEAQLLSFADTAPYRPTEITLAQALDWYLRRDTPKKRNAQRNHRTKVWKNHKLPQLELSQLTPAHFSEFRDEQIAKGRAANAVWSDRSLISDVFEVARLEWCMPYLESPFALLHKSKPGKGRDRRLTTEEAERFRLALDECATDLVGRVVHFAIHTAARQGEILRLKKADVDFDRRVAIFRGTKNRKDRVVWLTKFALATLRFNTTTDPHAFPVTRTEIRRAWRHVLERAAIKDFRFQDLRRDSTTRMFHRPSYMRVIFLRHKTLTPVPHYTKMDLGYTVERLDEAEKSEPAPHEPDGAADKMTVSDSAACIEEVESVGAPIVPIADGEPGAFPGTNSSDVKSSADEQVAPVVSKTRN